MTPIADVAAFAVKAILAGPPGRLLRLPLDVALKRSLRHHPGLLGRLGWQEERVILIEPHGLPVMFLLRCSVRGIDLEVLSSKDAPTVDARIAGPLTALLDLVVGDDDGDAQFFSRVLSFEGDTEAVVALRNAIDDAELDPLVDFLPLPRPLLPAARRALRDAARLARRVSTDMARLHSFLDKFASPPFSGVRQ